MNELKNFLTTNFRGCAAINRRRIPFNECVTILIKDGVMIEFNEEENLLQIFGLTDKDFYSLVDYTGHIINFD